MKFTWTLTIAALALPCAARAQTPADRIEAVRTQALSVGIPVSLIELKLAEGRAKGVPLEQLAETLERRSTVLQRAQEVLGRSSPLTPGELSVTGDALSAGVSEAVLGQLAVSAGAERRAVAIAALTHLVLSGQLPEHALQRVTAALARGGNEVAALAGNAPAGMARRGPPAHAATGGRRRGAEASHLPGGPPKGLPAPGKGPGKHPDKRPQGDTPAGG